jgi:hypothetical protein
VSGYQHEVQSPDICGIFLLRDTADMNIEELKHAKTIISKSESFKKVKSIQEPVLSFKIQHK